MLLSIRLAEWPLAWTRTVHSVYRSCLSCMNVHQLARVSFPFGFRVRCVTLFYLFLIIAFLLLYLLLMTSNVLRTPPTHTHTKYIEMKVRYHKQ